MFAITMAATVNAVQAGDGVTQSTECNRGWVAPVANPIYFESPVIGTEVRPIFIYQNLGNTLGLDVPGTGKVNLPFGGDVEVYALQLRVALTEKLALIATKDGYVDFNPDASLAHDEGWADIAAGLKYCVIDDKESKFLLTPGFTFKLPIGEPSAFQGNGNGELDIFASAAKAWGDFQVMGNLGVRVPMHGGKETSQLHYSLQLAYPTCKWFKPFFVLNGYTVLSDANGLPLTSEGYDLINFGSSAASGENQVVLGGGFRTELVKQFEIGFAYEKEVTRSDSTFDDRFTVDAAVRF